MDTNISSEDLDFLDVLIDDSIETLNKYIQQHGLNALDENKREILSILILEKKVNLSMYLIHNTNIDLNHKDKNAYTPLHFAVQNNLHPVVCSLLEKGAAVDALDKFGNTPLFKSVTEKVDPTIIRALIDHGANPNKTNVFGYSPLTFILKSMPDIAKIL